MKNESPQQTALARTRQGEEMAQLVIAPEIPDSRGAVLRVGKKTFLTRKVYGTISKDAFYSISRGSGDNKVTTYHALVEAKLKIMALAGVDWSEGHFVHRSDREVTYEAIGKWLMPTGQQVTIKRTRTVSLDRERRAQLLKKARYWLAERSKPNAGEKSAELMARAQREIDERMASGETLEDAILAVARYIVPLPELAQVADNMAEMALFLEPIAQSKAESQLGTACLRRWGLSPTFRELPREDEILVTVLNTVELPSEEATEDVTSTIYAGVTEEDIAQAGPTAEVFVGDEGADAVDEPADEPPTSAIVEEAEVCALLEEAKESEIVACSQDPEEAEPIPDTQPSAPSRSDLRAALQTECMRIGWTPGKFAGELKRIYNTTHLKDLEDHQLADLLLILRHTPKGAQSL